MRKNTIIVKKEGMVRSGNGTVLLSVSGRSTNFGNSKASASCACSRCAMGLFGMASLNYLFLPLSWRRLDMY